MICLKRHFLPASLGTLLVILGLISCGSAPGDETAQGEGAIVAAAVDGEATALDWAITPEGLGPVAVGMTLGEIKSTLGADYEFTEIPNFMVDFGAIEVSQGGEPLFYLLHFAGEPLTDEDAVTWIQVESDRFQTPEGIGPGSSIEEAAAVYGPAMLNYNSDDEMREYVQFENQPETLSFRTTGEPGAFAGLYEMEEGSSYQETYDYQPDAAIASVLIDGFQGQSSATSTQVASLPAEKNQSAANYAAADDWLNQVYQSVKAELPAADQERLTDVQLDWLAFRDGYCGAVTYDYEDTEDYQALLNGCLASLTENRSNRLQESLETGFFTNGQVGIDPGVVVAQGNEIDCAEAGTTPEINYCASIAADIAQEQTETAYSDLLETLSPKAQTLLLESQEAWKTYQRGHCEFAVKDAVGGTGYGAFLASCEQALALERADELGFWLSDN